MNDGSFESDLSRCSSGSSGLVLITDIGSTTTKGLLIRRSADASGYRFLGMVDSPTTVEKPNEDVRVGLKKVVAALEKLSGEKLSRTGGMPSVPYLATSSAGGGLQMLVVGLTSTETGRIAENTACGAGGVVLRTVTIDDSLSAVEKMMHIQELHPDMVLLAGGTDGGDIAGVVRLSELLKLADPQPKFQEDARIPLVFCGNTDAREFVLDVLRDTFEMSITDNVRPSMAVLNLEPARREVHRLFMDSVMERAPGYSELKEFTVSDILPTPAAVERILDIYAESRDGDVVMMDMGGATTDIFSKLDGTLTRTVAANTGMSYSMSNVLADSGIDSLMRHLPEDFDPGTVRNYIYNKTLSPTSVPLTWSERLIEQAVAAEGARSAWRDHLDVCRKNTRIGYQDRRKQRDRKEFREALDPVRDDGAVSVSGISHLIGAGGVFSHMEPVEALQVIAEGFLPQGITRISVDRHFRSPHMGVLSTIDRDAALDLFRKECLEEAGWVVAPVGRMKKGDKVLTVTDRTNGTGTEIAFGEFHLFERGGDLDFTLHSGDLPGGEILATELPVLVDCRGRGKYFSEDSISLLRTRGRSDEHGTIESSLAPAPGTVKHGDWEIEYRLPYDGELLVKEGDAVRPGTVLGQNRFAPPRLYVIDLNRIPGYDRHLTPDEIRSGLLLGEGDEVRINQALYDVHRSGLTGFDFTFSSPVRGTITRIEENGLIIVREMQDYDDRPHVVDVAKPLGVKPKHIRSHLKFRTGDFVSAGQSLAGDMSKRVFVISPSTGVLKDIDTESGTVTIQYDIRPVRLVSNLEGTVSGTVPARSVTVSGKGAILNGVIGFGGKTSGPVLMARSTGDIPGRHGAVLVSTRPIDGAYLARASEMGATGIIAPSIQASEWVRYSGTELGVAVTGSEELDFTLILTSGFGDHAMTEEIVTFLSEAEGSIAGLSGATQVRTGVIRPTAVICL